MIQNILFSLGIVLPIFLVIIIGNVLKLIGFVDQDFVKKTNRIIFYVALPLKLFNDVRTVDLRELTDIRFFAYIAAAIICSFIFVWVLSYPIKIEQSQRGSFVQGSFRGTFPYVGFPIIENISGTLGAKPPIVLAMIVPIYSFLAVLVFTVNKRQGGVKSMVWGAIMDLLKNPMILAIILGMAAAAFQPPIPEFALNTIGYFHALTTPLALLSIGATFDFAKLGARIKATAWASVFKLVIIPALAVAGGLFMGFGSLDLVIIYVLFGVPTSTVSFIIAVGLDGDGELASSIIMATTLFSSLSITLFIFAFKSLGII